MKYKAIIMDVDGTAVKSSAEALPTKRVIDAVTRAKKKIHVCIATSRPIIRVIDVIKALGIDGPCVVSDSTQIYDPVTDKIIKTIYLDDDVASQVHSILLKHDAPILLNLGTSEYMYKEGEIPKNLCGICVPDIDLVLADALITEISKISRVSIFKVPSYKKGLAWVTIASPKATKLHGVMSITHLLGIHPYDVIGIGDGYNDFPLLEAAGLAVAMGNAVPELKAIADYIAPTVDEDGVAAVIEKFILSG